MRHHLEIHRPEVTRRAARAALTALAGAALVLLAPPLQPLAAQGAAEETGALAGVVQDAEGHGLVAAHVTLVDGDGRSAVTDEEGNFLILRVPLGSVKLSVHRLGYEQRELSVYVGRARSTSTVTVVLTQIPQQIATVEVRAKRGQHTGPMADFYHRLESHANGGTFFTREQIDSMRPFRTTDILRRVPGFSFTNSGGPGGAGAERVIRSRDRRCSPLIWVDGTPATIAYYDPDLINPRTIEGIEVYAGVATVPPLLEGPAGTSSCGAIAIWTREGDRSANRQRQDEREAAATALAALVDSVQVYTEAEVDRVAMLAPSPRFAPVYPAELRRAKVTGVVVTEFVVDARGSLEPSTLGVVYSADPLFTESVTSALAGAKFTPAMRAGHPVRQLVQLPVHFVDPEEKQ